MASTFSVIEVSYLALARQVAQMNVWTCGRLQTRLLKNRFVVNTLILHPLSNILQLGGISSY